MPKQFVRQVDNLSIIQADRIVPVVAAPFQVATAQNVRLWLFAPDACLVDRTSGSVNTTIAFSITVHGPNFAATPIVPNPPITMNTGEQKTLSLASDGNGLALSAGMYLAVGHVSVTSDVRLLLPHLYLMVSGTG